MLEEFYKLGALQALEDAGLLEKEAKGRKWQQLMHAVAEGGRAPTGFGKALGVKGKVDAALMDAMPVHREFNPSISAKMHGKSPEVADRINKMRGIAKRDYGAYSGDTDIKRLLDKARAKVKAKPEEI